MYVCALTERRLLVRCLRTFELNSECVLEQELFLVISKIFIAIWYFHLKEKFSCSYTIFINEDVLRKGRRYLGKMQQQNIGKTSRRSLKRSWRKCHETFWRQTVRNFSVNFKTTLGNILNLQGTIGEQVLKQGVTQNYSFQIFVKFSLGI